MYIQVKTQETAKIKNGEVIRPVATLKSDGGVAHIWIDDDCYQLGIEKDSCDEVGHVYTEPVTHIFAEAFEVLKNLPELMPSTKDGFAFSKALAWESLELRGKYSQTEKVFNGVTFEDIYKYAEIVAYKTAKNLKNGFRMNWSESPLK